MTHWTVGRGPSTGSLVICGTCHEVRGLVPDRDDGAQQSCSCPTPEDDSSPRGWGGDFDTYAELCRCCGLNLLPSGSRWSFWFCELCKPLVRALNRTVGRCVVPVGRHSLMNGAGIRLVDLQTSAATESATESAAESLFKATLGMVGGMVWLEERRREVVRRNLEALGFDPDGDVYVGKYLWTVRRSELTAEDAFVALTLDVLARPQAA